MEIVVFVGLQASGKSSFYRSRFARSHALVSKDLLRNNRNRERRQRELVAAALARGESVVVDNTNPTAADRAPLVAIARASGARAVCYYFESRVADCLARNAAREGRARVSEIGIFSIAARLAPPSAEEEFDERYYVKFAEQPGAFSVEPWKEEEPR